MSVHELKRVIASSQEVIYHSVAFLLYLAAALTLLVEVNRYRNQYYSSKYDAYLAAAVRHFTLFLYLS